MNKKVIIVYSISIAIIIGLTLFGLLWKKPMPIEQPLPIETPTAPAAAEHSPEVKTPQEEQEPLELPELQAPGIMFGGGGGGAGNAGGGGGGGSGGSMNITTEDPDIPICPSKLDVEYFIDYKETTSTKDDDVYIGIRNNKPQIERIHITIEDYDEGIMEVRSLGVSVMKSEAMTEWWDSLNEITSRTFLIELEPENCQPLSSEVTVSYPPTETDYLD